jgi:hypothetical protein
MNPPGMTEDELRIAIAEELALCNEWKEAFQEATIKLNLSLFE